MKQLVEEDHQQLFRDIFSHSQVCHRSVHIILLAELKMNKIASNMLPKVLTAEQKRNCVLTANIILNNLDTDPTLLERIMKGDESWLFEYSPSIK